MHIAEAAIRKKAKRQRKKKKGPGVAEDSCDGADEEASETAVATSNSASSAAPLKPTDKHEPSHGHGVRAPNTAPSPTTVPAVVAERINKDKSHSTVSVSASHHRGNNGVLSDRARVEKELEAAMVGDEDPEVLEAAMFAASKLGFNRNTSNLYP